MRLVYRNALRFDLVKIEGFVSFLERLLIIVFNITA